MYHSYTTFTSIFLCTLHTYINILISATLAPLTYPKLTFLFHPSLSYIEHSEILLASFIILAISYISYSLKRITQTNIIPDQIHNNYHDFIDSWNSVIPVVTIQIVEKLRAIHPLINKLGTLKRNLLKNKKVHTLCPNRVCDKTPFSEHCNVHTFQSANDNILLFPVGKF